MEQANDDLSASPQQRAQQQLAASDTPLMGFHLFGQEISERAQQHAQQQLAAARADTVDSLLADLKREGQKQKRRRNGIYIGVTCYFLFMLTLAILTHDAHGMGAMGGMTGLLVTAAAATKAQKQAAKTLAQFEDLRIVGPLAEVLELLDKDTAAIAESALIRLLPRLQASDAHLLSEEQRKALCRALKRKNAALVIATLKALMQIGDAEALPYVEKLAQGEGLTARDPAVCQEAQDCLPFLRLRAEQEHARQTLLRAAGPTVETRADTLLRPASGGAVQIDPQQLLRASTSETDQMSGSS